MKRHRIDRIAREPKGAGMRGIWLLNLQERIDSAFFFSRVLSMPMTYYKKALMNRFGRSHPGSAHRSPGRGRMEVHSPHE